MPPWLKINTSRSSFALRSIHLCRTESDITNPSASRPSLDRTDTHWLCAAPSRSTVNARRHSVCVSSCGAWLMSFCTNEPSGMLHASFLTQSLHERPRRFAHGLGPALQVPSDAVALHQVAQPEAPLSGDFFEGDIVLHHLQRREPLAAPLHGLHRGLFVGDDGKTGIPPARPRDVPLRAVRRPGRVLIHGDKNAVYGLGLAAMRGVGVAECEVPVVLRHDLAARQPDIAFLGIALDRIDIAVIDADSFGLAMDF